MAVDSVIRSIFNRTPPLRYRIFGTVRSLGRQHARLELAANRLRERNESLLDTCKSAIKNGHKERAAIYANEVGELRKSLRTIMHAQLAMEQVIQRLETLMEVDSVITDLRSVLNVTQSVAKQLIKVMPEIAFEMNKLNNLVTEIVDVTKLGSKLPIVPLGVKDVVAEGILREASTLLEEELREKIPEPPIPVIAEERPIESVRQMVVLTTSGCEVCEQTKVQTRRYLSRTVQRSGLLKDWVLEYAQKNRGEVDLTKCAAELNIPSNDVLKALEVLNAQGKIRIEP